ncbi:MAG TPA: peptide ABC transporter substrate-binding protein [Verrucomicrobiae bacterium]|nr:peptide ABC transporter substrate-binding protein [Verrucomicrobiae bacterium]
MTARRSLSFGGGENSWRKLFVEKPKSQIFDRFDESLRPKVEEESENAVLGQAPDPMSSLRLNVIRCLLVLLFVSPLLGCRRDDTRGEIVICNGAEPESLDPAAITGQPDLRVVGALFEGLTRLNPQTVEPEPAIAQSWEISPDKKTYLFHLRTNALWSTGEPITAEDVVYSWRRVVDPETAAVYAGQLYYIKNAQEINKGQLDKTNLAAYVVDPFTLRVELRTPIAFFLDLCAFRTLAVVPRQAIEKHGDRWLMSRPLPASGPYTLEFWRIQDRIRVRKNPRYWDVQNIKNETVDFLPLQSATTALNLYETGEADIVWDKDLIPAELLDVLLTRPDCHTFHYLGTYFIRLNTTRPMLKDPRVRKALALAVDKERLVAHLTRGGERIAPSFTPYGVARYTPPDGLKHNPDLARQLLAEAGYPGGKGFPPISYLFNSSKVHERIGVELQQMWQRELGITVELRQAEWQVYLAAQTALSYDTCRGSWIGDYNDANTFLEPFLSDNGNNRTGWTNSTYDHLVAAANEELDITRRAELMRQAETILVNDDVPIVPLYFYKGINLFDPKKIAGVYNNILDEHPIYTISRTR